MALHLVSPPPSPPIEALSPARRELAQHLDREAELRQKLRDLDQVQQRASQAAHVEIEARQALVDLDIAERSAWDAWASAPTSPVPQNRSDERAALHGDINAAAATARASQRAVEAVAPAAQELAVTYRELAASRDHLIGMVLLEDAQALEVRFVAAVRVVGDIRAALEGAEVALKRLGLGNEASSIAATLAGLRLVPGGTECLVSADERAAHSRNRQRIRTSYIDLASRLAGDATATVTEENQTS